MAFLSKLFGGGAPQVGFDDVARLLGRPDAEVDTIASAPPIEKVNSFLDVIEAAKLGGQIDWRAEPSDIIDLLKPGVTNTGIPWDDLLNQLEGMEDWSLERALAVVAEALGGGPQVLKCCETGSDFVVAILVPKDKVPKIEATLTAIKHVKVIV